jgi:hypothetical protein
MVGCLNPSIPLHPTSTERGVATRKLTIHS